MSFFRTLRIRPSPTQVEPSKTVTGPASTSPKLKFTKQQIEGRLRQLKLLYEEGLLTDTFYDERVAECETGN